MSAYTPALQSPSQHHPARDSSFIKLTRTLLQATEWISLTTGESLSLSASEKLLWVWMRDRHDFFKGAGRDWYDNQDSIAAATGTSVATVKRWLGKLEKHGYLERKCLGLSNSYTLKADLQLSPTADAPRNPVVVHKLEPVVAIPTLVTPALVKPVNRSVTPFIGSLDDDGDDFDPFSGAQVRAS